MSLIEFTPWPKTARLNREMIVTEKIDGTNAAIRIDLAAGLGLPGNLDEGDTFYGGKLVRDDNDMLVLVNAQSRKKLIAPKGDNYGFATWVHENAQNLASVLGEGIHFGEWYGQGIQRKYGLDEKRFMLFNTTRWGKPETRELLRGRFAGRVEAATVLYQGMFDTDAVNGCVDELREGGSVHVEGFMDPEGVIAHHVPSQTNFKVTCVKDEKPKGATSDRA